VDTSRPDTIAGRPRFRTHNGHCPQCPAGCGSPPCGGHPGLDSRPRRGSATAVDTAGGGRLLPSPAGRAWTVGRRRPPCPCSAQGSRGCGGEQPSGQHPAALPDVRRTLPRCPVPRIPLGSGRRSRQTPTVRRSDSGRGLRTPAARRRPALWTPATAAWARGHCGSGLLDSRQRNRPLPLTCPAGNGTARCGIGQHRHGQTARSVAWCSASIRLAPDGSGLLRLGTPSIASGPDGSRRIVWMIKRMIKQSRQLDHLTAADLDSAVDPHPPTW
jgi:hypothetical protein